MKNIVCNLKFLISSFVLLNFSLAYSQVSGVHSVAGEYIVKIKSRSGESSNGRLSAGMKLVSKIGPAIKIKQAFWGSEMMHIKAESQASIDALQANPDIEFIEPNYILSVDPVDVQPFGAAPTASDQYDQSNSNVRVTEAWSIEKPYNQGSKTIVAVIDTGLDTSHGLFADSNAIWVNSAEANGLPGVDDDNNGYIDDINGWNYVSGSPNVADDDDHGTHVSGIILGVGQDVLANPVRESKIKIMSLKFLDNHGSGTTANAISAMYYAVNMGARVINNSWGGSSYSRSLHEAYTYAYNHGVVVATAAGNAGSNNDSVPMYPANLDTPNNISVAATTDSDNKASFSNYGSTVSVAAPGVAIISSVPGAGCLSPGCYQMMSGTSMASPFVAGLAALIVREAPQLSAYQIKNIIMSTVDPISSLNGKIASGGRVNVQSAITSALSQVSVASYSPSYSPVYKVEQRSVASEQTAAPAAGCGLVKAMIDEASSGGGPTSGSTASQVVVVLVMVMVPVALAAALRVRSQEKAKAGIVRRKFARYNLAKDLILQVGDQFVKAATDTVSVGGISFSSALQVQKGEKIKIKIADLDQEVEGEVVWCSQKQSYGVRFLNITDQLQTQMNTWTLGLSPTT